MACCVYDFTLFISSVKDVSYVDVSKCLRSIAKKWAYQLETTEKGKLHYQGRFSLFKKTTHDNCCKLFIAGAHLSQTSAAGSKDIKSYVNKVQTRISGPWCYDDPVTMSIPVQYRIDKYYPYQEDIMNGLYYNMRSINLVYDPLGGRGKSSIATHLVAAGRGFQIPSFNNYRDLLALVLNFMGDKTEHTTFVVDMPRALEKKNLKEIYAALETIKGGYVCDTRYKFKFHYFDAPTIWVFTNVMPPESYYTPDRWCMLRINSKNEFRRI